MKNKVVQMLAVAAIVALAAFVAGAADDSDQAEFPQVVAQPTDQDVEVGSDAVLTVEATNGDSYQWLRNGTVMTGETNDSLVLANVGANDAGYYSCAVIKGSEVVPT